MATTNVRIFLDAARDALHGGGLTPLQAKEIEEAMKTHEECNFIDDASLQDQRNQIENHWTAIASTITRRGGALFVLRLFAHSLAGVLLEEYCKLTPPLDLVPMKHYLKIYGSPEERQAAADILTKGDESRLDLYYEKTIIFSIAELLLDREHVEARLRSAAAGINFTEMLIKANNHAHLKEVIDKDLASLRQLVLIHPKLEKAQYCVDIVAQSMLRQLQHSVAPSSTSKASSFWSTLGDRLGIFNTPSPALAQSLSSARLLLADEKLAKKTV